MVNQKVKLVQQKEIELLKTFDQICQTHGFTYYALGGTLLGAIRHQGFIPWDDDMDLGMPRKDYEKFLANASEILPERIELVIHDDNLNNTSIRDTSTAIRFGSQDCHPFIDIFPLDGFPKQGIKRSIHKQHIMFYRMLSKISVIDRLLERDRGTVENIIVKISKLLRLNKFLNTNKINNKLQKVIQKYDFDTSPYAGNILGTYRDKEIVKRTVFGKPQRLVFDDFLIAAHEQPEAYLEHVYGDFMTLPSEDKRYGHFESTYGK